MTRGLRRRLTSYGDEEFSLFLRKAFIKAMGYSDDALDRPIVGIANTYSDYNPCHGNVPQLIEAAKRGVMLAGGMPMVFPTMSIHESFAAPTSMFLRNLMAMETEEMVRAQPMDAVILIGGCDKTIPAQMMAAASSEVPAIILPTGPMETGNHRGERLGACTDCRRIWGQYRAGTIDGEEIGEINGRLVSSVGTCTVMGTASTMACLVEAMGLALPMSGSAPATSAERVRIAEETGRAAVAMAHDGPTAAEVLTPSALRNGLAVLQALGGSTNAVVHLAAVYGRLGRKLDMAELDRLGREVPVLVDLKPSGVAYMGEFHAAGGVPRLLSEIADVLDLSAPRAFGGTIADAVAKLPARHEEHIIRRRTQPVSETGAIAVLSGNLAPRGAVIKHSAASPALQVHEGRAVVFESVEDMTRRLDDDETLAIAADDVLVLRNAGPKGAPGMPEAGYIPIPRHLARQGVKDMVRISDARMSGTAFGTVILHVTPEAADGGPLAIVRTGDRIRLDVPARRLELLVPPEELEARMAALEPRPSAERRGYARLYQEHVMQADDGVDFDFLQDGVDG
ncbi:dihydroxy-acid dehydratase [Devosia geojensis]|uniref:Dihydroxy-acid dehydratase n=1 Tax=Devosia geojensis TaxID=443610 RepID=A0A0F5FS86_9HYPH|nr:IlvD/Edd family dehydratase [Devosia geojensis]KKB11726.1 dihydroxy-acid dehydratase [Devosia geojensis]